MTTKVSKFAKQKNPLAGFVPVLTIAIQQDANGRTVVQTNVAIPPLAVAHVLLQSALNALTQGIQSESMIIKPPTNTIPEPKDDLPLETTSDEEKSN